MRTHCAPCCFAPCQFEAELLKNAKFIASAGKGILAADESTGTIGSRFDEIKLQNTHENRIEYRRLLFTTPNLQQHISGVILFEETLFDKDPATGQLLVKPLVDAGILLGIKVDQGTKVSTCGTRKRFSSSQRMGRRRPLVLT